jgi:dethiobiotin synthetase
MPAKIFFITGTDTGVGKTLLTALLLTHLRRRGHHVLALKPFCSGSRADAKLLHTLQASLPPGLKTQNSKLKTSLTLDDINPFHFPEPLAPLVAARKHRRKITLRHALSHVARIVSSINPSIHQSINPTLLIEGAGGLLAPLGEDFNLLDLLLRFCPPSPLPRPSPQVIVVAPNRLGTINHTLLTVRALHASHSASNFRTQTSVDLRPSDPGFRTSVVLMSQHRPDPSASSNPRILSELLAPVPVVSLPFLGSNCCTAGAVKTLQPKVSRKLLEILS